MEKVYGDRASLEEIPRQTEEVFAAGKWYILREMVGTERDLFEISIFKPKTNGSGEAAREVDPLYLRSRMLVMTLVDKEGKRLYKDSEAKALSDSVPASAIGKLFAAAQKLNGITPDAVEEAAKNSDATPSDDSPSDSPGTSEKPSLNS